MITLMKSGHCNTAHLNRVPSEAHARCQMAQCPCACHFQGERYECGCGGTLVEAPQWPADPAEPDEPVYTHIDHDGSALGEMCP